ncbi:MAG: FAD-dependent oxidoreductase [Chitinivibrionales bacterium]|nr:FAD-dependent oxidoreductase [Chitinivibrionales bacterium]
MKFQYNTAKPLNEYSVPEGKGFARLDRKTIAKDIPCQEACPAKTNVPGYIEAIAQGDNDRAYRINQECNVFAGVLGRICTRPCESRCRHQWTNIQGPVDICHLKRYAADHVKQKATPLDPWIEQKSGKTIAVVGGGPAGLTAARELHRLGHTVTVFEREDHLGGMMIDGIPAFRLPPDVVRNEISLIIDAGIEVRYKSNVDKHRMQQLADEYDAVLLAAGTMLPNTLSLPGLDESVECFDGLDFMKQYNSNCISDLKGNFVIIGGGFTAVDCARSCARAAKRIVGDDGDVSIMYRRSEHFMSADSTELEEIEKENVAVRTLVTPVSVTSAHGKITSATFRRNMLSSEPFSGKPKIIPVENSEFTLDCDHLIVAIGQQQEWDILPGGIELKENHRTSCKNLFAAGDFETGSNDVIHAVAEGRSAALAIDRFLTGEERLETYVKVETTSQDGDTGRVRDHDLQVPRHMPLLPMFDRAVDNNEVETGYHDDDGLVNATRCYFCHYKFEIDQDKCIHCDWCIQAAPRECIKKVSRVFEDKDGAATSVVEANLSREGTYIWIDSDNCIRCGKCLRVCPTEAISMKRTTLTTCAKH